MKLRCKGRAGPICHDIETKLLKLPLEKLFVPRWVSGHDNALFQSLWHIVIKSYRNVLVYHAVSGCPHVTTFRITEFYAIWCWAVLSKFFNTVHFWFKLEGNAHILHEDLTCNFCVHSSVTCYISEWKMFCWKVSRIKWNTFNARCSFS